MTTPRPPTTDDICSAADRALHRPEHLAERPERAAVPRGRLPPLLPDQPAREHWGNISWGHATSTDLVTWAEQDIAIPQRTRRWRSPAAPSSMSRNTARIRRTRRRPPWSPSTPARVTPHARAAGIPGPVARVQPGRRRRRGPGTPATPCSTSARTSSATRRSSGTAATMATGSWSRSRPWTAGSWSTRSPDLITGLTRRTSGPPTPPTGCGSAPTSSPSPSTRHRRNPVGARRQHEPRRHRRRLRHASTSSETSTATRFTPDRLERLQPTRPTTTGWTTAATTTPPSPSTTSPTNAGS